MGSLKHQFILNIKTEDSTDCLLIHAIDGSMESVPWGTIPKTPRDQIHGCAIVLDFFEKPTLNVFAPKSMFIYSFSVDVTEVELPPFILREYPVSMNSYFCNFTLNSTTESDQSALVTLALMGINFDRVIRYIGWSEVANALSDDQWLWLGITKPSSLVDVVNFNSKNIHSQYSLYYSPRFQ